MRAGTRCAVFFRGTSIPNSMVDPVYKQIQSHCVQRVRESPDRETEFITAVRRKLLNLDIAIPEYAAIDMTDNMKLAGNLLLPRSMLAAWRTVADA